MKVAWPSVYGLALTSSSKSSVEAVLLRLDWTRSSSDTESLFLLYTAVSHLGRTAREGGGGRGDGGRGDGGRGRGEG